MAKTDMKTATRLVDLPFDLILSIFHTIDGIDVASLRQTCRSLYSIEKEFHHSIWNHQAARLNIEAGFFRPTLNCWGSPDREPIVARAEVMRSILRNNQATFLERPIHSDVWDMHFDCTDVHYVSLLPGGRFLITISSEELCLWDLGLRFTDEEYEEPTLLLAKQIQLCTSAEVFAPQDSTKVGILLHHHSSGQPLSLPHGQCIEYRRYHELRFNESSFIPAYVQVGDIQVVMERGRSIHLERRSKECLCVVIPSGSVLLWNFVKGTYATWVLPEATSYDDVFILKERIFFFSSRKKCLSTALIPPLHPLPFNRTVELLALFQRLDLTVISMPDVISSTAMQYSQWSPLPCGAISTLSGPVSPIYAQYNEGTGHFCSEWRHLSDGNSSEGPLISPPIKQFTHRFPLDKVWFMDNGVQRMGSSRSVITCGLWETWRNEQQFYATISSFPMLTSKPRPGADGYQVLLLSFFKRPSVVWDFCPLSGLMVVVAAPTRREREQGQGHTIRIHDFVRPYLSSRAQGSLRYPSPRQ